MLYQQTSSIRRYIILTLVVVFCLLGSSSFGQEVWTGASVKVKFTKNFSGDVEQQFRFNDGFYTYQSRFTEAGLKYKLMKNLSVKASYRHTDKAGPEFNRALINNRQRISGDLSYEIGNSKTKFIFTYRIRYQHTRRQQDTIPSAVDYIRNKFELGYNLTKKVQPYLEYELFYRLNQKDEIRLHRYSMGLKSQISKRLDLDTFYRLENEVNVKYPKKAYIIGVMITYKINLRRKDLGDDE